MTTVYNKLIRDNIPSIIEKSGRTPRTRILDEHDYVTAIDRKLDEELAEYHENPCLEELADLMEVIYAAAQARGFSALELEKVRLEKAAVRGGFAKRVFLESVEDEAQIG